MNKDKIEGAAKDVAGSMKEGLGKAIGNDRMVIEGASERAVGKMQKGVGALKDAAHKAFKS